MGKGGGGGKTISGVEPWKGQQPYLKDLYEQAQQWYQSQGQGAQIPPMSGVSGFDPMETQGQDYLAQLFGGPQFQEAMGAYKGAIGQALGQQPGAGVNYLGMGELMGPAQQQAQNFSSLQTLLGPALQQIGGFTPLNLGMLENLDISKEAIQQMMSANPDMSVWGPAMEAAAQVPTQQFREQVIPGLASQSLGAGGFGGSRHAIAEGVAGGKLAEALQRQQAGMGLDMARETLAQRQAGAQLAGQRMGTMGQLGLGLGQLETDRAQMLGQLGLGAGNLQTSRAQVLGQLGLGAGELDVRRQDLLQRARQGDIGAALQAASMIPQGVQMGMMPGQVFSQIGEQRRGMQQAQLDEQIQRWLMEQQGNLPALQQYSAMMGQPIAGQSQQAYRGSPLAGAAGGALTGAGAMGALAGAFPGVGWLGGPWGAGIGAGLGALMGMF